MIGGGADLGELPRSVARVLADAGVDVRVVDHGALPGPVRSPADVARMLPIDIDRIAKTLFVVEAPARRLGALVVLGVRGRLALDAVAQLLDWSAAVLASPDELHEHIGQPPTGVSPLGAPAGVVVVVDQALASGAPLLVGAGVPGREIQLAPDDLVRLTAARVAAVARAR